MRISLDFDGTLSNTMGSWLRFYNKDHPDKKLYYNDIQQWDFNKKLGMSTDEFFEYLKKCWSNWEDLEPVESHLDTYVGEIQQHHKVDVVTSVLPSHVRFVKKWLKHYDIPYNKLLQSEDKLKMPYNLYIDDRPDLFSSLLKSYELLEVTHKNKYGIMYRQPWNSEMWANGRFGSTTNVIIANSWKEIVTYIHMFEERN